MSYIEFDIYVAKGVVIVVAYYIHPFVGWRYTLFVLTNQNHCYIYTPRAQHFVKCSVWHSRYAFNIFVETLSQDI